MSKFPAGLVIPDLGVSSGKVKVSHLNDHYLKLIKDNIQLNCLTVDTYRNKSSILMFLHTNTSKNTVWLKLRYHNDI
jgi:hypothetical protein